MCPKKGFDCVAFSFKKSVGNLIDDIREKALYVCENLKKCVEKKKRMELFFIIIFLSTHIFVYMWVQTYGAPKPTKCRQKI